jgi:beta-lactamase class D OXA-211
MSGDFKQAHKYLDHLKEDFRAWNNLGVLANTQLAFKPDVQHAVQDMLLIEQKPNYKLYAKSGWGMDLEPQVGWWTGWVETATGEKVYFALNMHMKTGISASVRRAN